MATALETFCSERLAEAIVAAEHAGRSVIGVLLLIDAVTGESVLHGQSAPGGPCVGTALLGVFREAVRQDPTFGRILFCELVRLLAEVHSSTTVH